MSELTDAQERWCAAVTKWDHIGAAFQRAEEVGKQVTAIEASYIRGFEFRQALDRIVALESALESAAREPATTEEDDPPCANPECGHPRSKHVATDGVCLQRHGGAGFPYCLCMKFIPPAPPPAEPDDKGLFYIAEAYRAIPPEVRSSGACIVGAHLILAFGDLSSKSFLDSKAGILAYGKPKP